MQRRDELVRLRWGSAWLRRGSARLSAAAQPRGKETERGERGETRHVAAQRRGEREDAETSWCGSDDGNDERAAAHSPIPLPCSKLDTHRVSETLDMTYITPRLLAMSGFFQVVLYCCTRVVFHGA